MIKKTMNETIINGIDVSEEIDDCIPKKLIEMCNDACNKAHLCDALDSASVPVRDIFALFDTESELKGNKDEQVKNN